MHPFSNFKIPEKLKKDAVRRTNKHFLRGEVISMVYPASGGDFGCKTNYEEMLKKFSSDFDQLGKTIKNALCK